jgi:hypothetical protein
MSRIIQMLSDSNSKGSMFVLTDDGVIYRRLVYRKRDYSEHEYKWYKFEEEGLPLPTTSKKGDVR